MKKLYTFFILVIGFPFFSHLGLASPLYGAFLCSNSRTVPHTMLSYPSLTKSSSIQASNTTDEEASLRKSMRINAIVQRSWISSMVVPGLGQVYNKHYWKVPCIYLGFAILGYKIYSEHQEMHTHKRTQLITLSSKDTKVIQNFPVSEYTQKRIDDCKRTRNLFIMIAGAWYLLNIFDAYAGAHDKMVNFTDDIGTTIPVIKNSIVQPTAATSMVGLSLPIYF
ncbi:DUF5683 domain-containing protein [Cardinium endosymbiont of Tipula unca]|uniref:DUF5683 domain-containing protein n=1 Tax=Cardinium endosymbiont of Tipula unca TaxID=3066216 RepID=UPI0030D51571